MIFHRGARLLAFPLVVAALTAPARAAYPGRADPDWPCQSIKVADLSLGSVWTGPPVDAYAPTWEQDSGVAALARRVAERRLTLDDAAAAIQRFAAAAGPDRTPRLLALMAGVFDLLDTERREVVAGLDRFGMRQKQLAAAIRAESEATNAEQASPSASAEKLGTLMERLQLDTRVFDARRQSIQYACAVPATIEQRLYGLARAIQQALPAQGN